MQPKLTKLQLLFDGSAGSVCMYDAKIFRVMCDASEVPREPCVSDFTKFLKYVGIRYNLVLNELRILSE